MSYNYDELTTLAQKFRQLNLESSNRIADYLIAAANEPDQDTRIALMRYARKEAGAKVEMNRIANLRYLVTDND